MEHTKDVSRRAVLAGSSLLAASGAMPALAAETLKLANAAMKDAMEQKFISAHSRRRGSTSCSNSMRSRGAT